MKHCKKYLNRAFILGLCPNGLGAIRSIGRNGISVVGMDYKPLQPGLYSRFAKTMLCPNPYKEPDELCEFMMAWGRMFEEKAILYPTSDEFVLFVSRYRNRLSEHFLFALPSENIVESLLNKRWQYMMAEETGTPYPQTLYPEAPDDIPLISKEIEYPAIIKPCYTHVWKDKEFDIKGFLVKNRSELEDKMHTVFARNVDVIVQSVIPGKVDDFYEVCSYLNHQHNPLVVFIKRKIRQYPHDMGLGTYMESVLDDDLSKIAVRLLKGIKYSGIGEVEFKKDPRDGQYKMIEINTRITLQNSLADYCGINLPMIQYLDLLGDPVDIQDGYKEHSRWIWAELDFESFKELKARNEISFINWVGSILKSRSFAVFALDDLKPFFQFFKFIIERKLRYVSK